MAGDEGGGAAERFAEIARSLQTASTVDEMLQRIAGFAVETIAGCDHAGVSLIADGRISTAASTDPVVVEMDRIQSETGEGPCIDAIRNPSTFESRDLSQTREWPNFARCATAAGVRSVLGIPLFVAEDTTGALNLFSETVGGFDESARHVAGVFATHAAIALAAMTLLDRDFHTINGLEEALITRDVIGQAKGILMAKRNINAGEAFASLRRASQHENVKLRTIADQVIATGDLPTPY